ncbi:MAG: GAF domain-containing protein [Desulfobacteraceae bacterium]|nr:GAF domain-containing protein [Desulfobacteraceae bacterium]
MASDIKIGIDIFKAVTRSIAHSEDLEVMSNHMTQLLVAALDIKGCAIFVLNPVSEELEILASFGLSAKYLSKGPLSAPKSINDTFRGKAVIIPDVEKDNKLQYPEEAKKEGIAALVSLPIVFLDEVIGVLRLYHYQAWQVSDQDMDSLKLLSDNIGLAMTYTRFRNAVYSIGEIIGDTFQIQLSPNLSKSIGGNHSG